MVSTTGRNPVAGNILGQAGRPAGLNAGPALLQAGYLPGAETVNRSLRQNVKPPCTFYADAIGHPATTLYRRQYIRGIPVTAQPPLFHYTREHARRCPWRLGIAGNSVSGSDNSRKRKSGGEPGQHVGNLYPRSGFVNRQDGDKKRRLGGAARGRYCDPHRASAYLCVPGRGNRRMAIGRRTR